MKTFHLNIFFNSNRRFKVSLKVFFLIKIKNMHKYCTEPPRTPSSGVPHWRSWLLFFFMCAHSKPLSMGAHVYSWAACVYGATLQRHTQHGLAPLPLHSVWLTVAGASGFCCCPSPCVKRKRREKSFSHGQCCINWEFRLVFREVWNSSAL